ncbi:MAG: hypothetical protein H5T34_07235 [Candidatus Methanomethyliales bacterium]|nr:hypothetical protein [Candidatus Methanomethylicales archaeon]
MRLAYNALLAVLIGVVLVSSPLLLTGLSPTEFRSKVIGTQTASEYQKTLQNNESFSSSLVENQTSEVRTSVASELLSPSQYSLNGIFISLLLGIVAAALSYFLVKKEVISRIRLPD